MGFSKVYKTLQEIFPEVDCRILRAVAIEHCKDPATAVDVVLNEVIPCLAGKNKLPSTSSGQSEVAVKSSEAAVDANGAPQADATLLDKAKGSDEQKNGLPFYETSCGHHQTFEDTEGESLQHYHDAVGVDLVVFEGDESGAAVSMENCNKSNDKVSAYESCQITHVTPNAEDSAVVDFEKSGLSFVNDEKRGHSTNPEAISFKVNTNNGAEAAYDQLSQPIETVGLHDTLEETDDSPPLIHKRTREEVSLVEKEVSSVDKQLCEEVSSVENEVSLVDKQLSLIEKEVTATDNQDMKHSESQLASTNVETMLSGSDSSIELIVAPDVHMFELEKAELKDSINATSSEDLAGEMLENEVEAMPNPMVTASGQICSVDLLEDMITEAKSNKKTLFSAVESVICLMREAELQEEAAEKAKQEAANGGVDVLKRVEELKEMLQHAKEANDMHAGEVYGEKAILATEVKELQSRLLGLADKRDNSLAVLDEMRQTLELRIAAAEKEMKAAEEERLAKEEVARKALADQEIIMEKVVQESNILKQEAEENAKLRDFLVDRGRIVDTLQGEISVICKDVRSLKEKFDDHVPLSKSLCSSQTSCILASSSSSLKSEIPDQVSDPAEFFEAQEKMDTSSYYEENQVSGDVKSVTDNKDILDDGWEICDNSDVCA